MSAHNPLARDGTSQRQRGLPALAPAFAEVDERDQPALLVYLTNVARLLRYYGPNDVPDGDFSAFITKDPSTLSAELGTADPAQDAEDFRVVRLGADPAGTGFSAALARLVDLVFERAERLDAYLEAAPDGSAVRIAMERAIDTVLADALRDTRRVARRVHALEPTFPDRLPLVPRGPWGDIDVSGDASLFPANDYHDNAERSRAVERVATAHGRFVETSKRLKADAATLFADSLTNVHGHAPQMALLLATLDAFGAAQRALNGVTQRHFDFYLREVLRLAPRPAEPDHAHVVFELSKRPGSHAIAAATRLLAGKDAQKHDVRFATDVELAANHAKLDPQGVKTVFVERDATRLRGVYAAVVANSSDGAGAPFTTPEPRWPLFGDATLAPATLGFALASPMLWLTSGTRTIQLLFHLADRSFLDGVTEDQFAAELGANVRVEASGPKGWIHAGSLTLSVATSSTNGKFMFTIVFDPGAPPFVAPDAKTHGATYGASVPVLRFTLAAPGRPAVWNDTEVPDYSADASYAKNARIQYRNAFFQARDAISPNVVPDPNDDGTGLWERVDSHPYRYFEKMKVNGVQLGVKVDGLTNFTLENDFGPLNPSKPFPPFGPVPTAGSQFFVGCPEALNQPLTSLTLTITWKNVDSTLDLPTHYAGYGDDAPSSNDEFTVGAAVLSGGVWTSPSTQKLFSSPASNSTSFTFPLPSPGTSQGLVSSPTPAKLSPASRDGFVRLVLDKGFLSEIYPAKVQEYSTNYAGKPAPEPPTPTPVAPKPPFAPQAAAVTLGFRSHASIAYASPGDVKNRVHHIFRLDPFGFEEILLAAPASLAQSGVPLADTPVPVFDHVDATGAVSTAEGTLYLGFAGFAPPAELSLLFQLAEGSEDPTVDAPAVSWSYRTENGWQSFSRADVIADATLDLVASGILRVAVPRDASNAVTALPNGLHWLRATVKHGSRAIPGALGLHPQAVRATFVDAGNDPERLAVPLPSGSITKLERRDPLVKSVTQPYASFGGRRQESDTTLDVDSAASASGFYVRVSERLRHKRRAVSVFDYERLVLEAFPDVYKVRAINHTESSLAGASPCALEHAPGHVHVIAVPNLRNKNAVDPLRPRLALARLTAIHDYLRPLASDFARIEVTNPDYEEIKVGFAVRFKTGFDVGLYTTQLQNDIVRFLSPWLYDEAVDLTFGGRIHRSSILRFVDERPYVDFVTDFTMNQIVGTTVLADIEVAEATRASAVLVSAATHDIGDATTPCDDRGEGFAVTTPVSGGPPYGGSPKPSRARFLGNRAKHELHDLTNVAPNCQIAAITHTHRVWFDTVQAALAEHFDYCAFCFPAGWSKH